MACALGDRVAWSADGAWVAFCWRQGRDPKHPEVVDLDKGSAVVALVVEVASGRSVRIADMPGTTDERNLFWLER